MNIVFHKPINCGDYQGNLIDLTAVYGPPVEGFDGVVQHCFYVHDVQVAVVRFAATKEWWLVSNHDTKPFNEHGPFKDAEQAYVYLKLIVTRTAPAYNHNKPLVILDP